MKKILIADSNKSNLVITCEIFKDQFSGVQISTTNSGIETIAKIRNEQDFDLFIIDRDLPDENGTDLAKKVKNLFPQKPVFLIAFDNTVDFHDAREELTHLNNGPTLLRKPLHPTMIKALCAYHMKTNEAISTKPDNQIIGFIELNSSLDNHLTNIFLPIAFSEFTVTGVQIQIETDYLNRINLHQNKLFSLNTEIKNYTDYKCTIYLPDTVNQTNLNTKLQHFFFNKILTGKVDSKNLAEHIEQNYLLNLSGKVLNKTLKFEEKHISIWIEFDNLFSAKQLFDSIVRGQGNNIMNSFGQLYL